MTWHAHTRTQLSVGCLFNHHHGISVGGILLYKLPTSHTNKLDNLILWYATVISKCSMGISVQSTIHQVTIHQSTTKGNHLIFNYAANIHPTHMYLCMGLSM